MDIEKRLSNLENLVNALSKKIDNTKFYTDADIEGNKQSITEITPYTETKTAYIGDYQVLFENIPQGILTVSAVDSEGGFPAYVLEREGGIISVHFDNPLDYVTTVSISIQ